MELFMLFLAKKWIGGLLMPLPLFLTVFFIALILLFFTQKQKLAKLLLVLSFSAFFLLSLTPFSEQMIYQLEREHPPLTAQNITQYFDYILVLGAGGIADPSLPVNSQLSSVANSRFLEALRLYHANPNAIWIVSGSSFGDVKSHAQMMQEMAIMMGVPAAQIIRLDESRDSDDEAKKMSQLIQGKHAALVTSATHMDRALSLFYKYGTRPIAAPTNYLAKNRDGEIPSYYYIPSAYQLYKNDVIWHEYLGQAQQQIKNVIERYELQRYFEWQ